MFIYRILCVLLPIAAITSSNQKSKSVQDSKKVPNAKLSDTVKTSKAKGATPKTRSSTPTKKSTTVVKAAETPKNSAKLSGKNGSSSKAFDEDLSESPDRIPANADSANAALAAATQAAFRTTTPRRLATSTTASRAGSTPTNSSDDNGSPE